MKEGERGPARLEMLASTLVVTGVAALVAGQAAGRSLPHVSSFLSRHYCHPPRRVMSACRLKGRSSRRCYLLRSGRVPTENDLRWLAFVVAAGSSGGESGGIDPALFGGVSLIGVESGRRCPCMPCVGVSSWNGPCAFASGLRLLS